LGSARRLWLSGWASIRANYTWESGRGYPSKKLQGIIGDFLKSRESKFDGVDQFNLRLNLIFPLDEYASPSRANSTFFYYRPV
jgi:hypothetical protein